ncbi:MAG TPA: hypothetical protein VJ551_02445 [Nitrososphaeraceae archaeon]|nr:hypothetical protein [Nitrososphaeraceae archaeon]
MSIAWENTIETQEYSADSNINNKIKEAVAGLHQKCTRDLFLEFATDHDRESVADFIRDAVQKEDAPIITKKAYLLALARVAKHYNPRILEELTSKDLNQYLEDTVKNQRRGKKRTIEVDSKQS